MMIPEQIELEDKEYRRLSDFIMNRFGIKLPPSKKTLLQCRLQKRLKALHFGSFKQYVDYVFSSKENHDEISLMIDAVSTNKTDFFRETAHFDFLSEQGIRDYLKKTGKNRISIWSAGCSSGEEPYTIAMIMKDYCMINNRFDFSILATDISDRVLEHAVNGIYTEEKAQNIPLDFKRKYLLKGSNIFKNKVKVTPEIQEKVEYRKFNLLSPDYALLGKFDIIFCRNVLIYFDHDVQFRLLGQLTACLNAGGYLFLGHSESITGYTLPLLRIKPTIFQKVMPEQRSRR